MRYDRYLEREREFRMFLGFAATFFAVLLSASIRHRFWMADGERLVAWSIHIVPALVIGSAFVLASRILQVHRLPLGGRLARRTVIAVGFAIGTSLAASSLYQGESHAWVSVAIWWPIAVVLVIGGFAIYYSLHEVMIRRFAATRRVLIAGTGEVGSRIGGSLDLHPGFYVLVGYVECGDSDADLPEGFDILGTSSELEMVVRAYHIEEVIIAPDSITQEAVLDLVGRCLRAGVSWKVVPEALDLNLDRSEVDFVAGIPMIGIRGPQLVGIDWFAKRTFDVLFSALVLVVASPLLLIIFLAVKWSSRGPALYSQTRVGRDGQEFKLYKFRTMYVDTDAGIHQNHSAKWIFGLTGDESGGLHKMATDPRITPLGSLLRKASLDELPQFWNVARGDMSVVGPRPAIPYEVDQYTEWHRGRLQAPPGITGLWQVSGRNELSFDEMVRLDIGYIEAWSLKHDLRIVARTIPALFAHHGY